VAHFGVQPIGQSLVLAGADVEDCAMRILGLVLVAALVAMCGCGSGSSDSAKAPAPAHVKTVGSGTGASVAVAAQAPVTPKSLCALEGKSRPKRACVAGLRRLSNGKAQNPAAACKGLAKKKTKGTRGKSPFAVCVTAAAKLMATQNHLSKNGAADNNPSSSGDSSDSSGDSSDSMTCFDADGNEVSPDDPNVDNCTDSSDASGTGDNSSADDSSSDSSDSSDTSSADDTSTDSSP
jgi:hypothetical protein